MITSEGIKAAIKAQYPEADEEALKYATHHVFVAGTKINEAFFQALDAIKVLHDDQLRRAALFVLENQYGGPE
jgi:hypothetical protein